LSFAEYLGLIDKAAQHLKSILIVAFYTGMRLGELRTLKWSYVDLKNKMIRLPEKATKEGKAKNIPVNEHVVKVLLSLPRALHHGFVFTYRSKPVKAKEGFKTSFKTACENADIPHGRKTPNGITFHDIRRTVKTNMVNAGVDKVYRDTILGHSLKGMDAHYVVPSEENRHRAMARYTEWVDGKIAINDQDNDQVDKSAVCESVNR
jgi:integrase